MLQLYSTYNSFGYKIYPDLAHFLLYTRWDTVAPPGCTECTNTNFQR